MKTFQLEKLKSLFFYKKILASKNPYSDYEAS